MAKLRRKRRKPRRPSPLVALIALGVVVVGGIGLVVWLLVGGGGGGLGPSRGAGPRQATATGAITLFYSCDIGGRIAPYNCEEGKIGGVARMATILKQWRQTWQDGILVDVGNATVASHPQRETVNSFTYDALEKLRYDVVNIGENEVGLSLEDLRTLAKDRSFKIISASLVRADTRAPVFPPYYILERARRKIGFIGLVHTDVGPKGLGKGLRLLDPDAALRQNLAIIRPQCDLVVVLAFLTPEEIYKLARQYPEVDVFLGGLTPVSSAPFEVAGPRAAPRTIVSYLGDQGCTLARLTVQRSENGPPLAQGSAKLLDEDVEQDPSFIGLLSEFTAALSGTPLPGSDQDPKMPCTSSFVGSEVCKVCHIKQFYDWQETAHAGAYVTLIQKGQNKNPECLRCHTTGYDLPWGFDPAREAQKPPKDEETPKRPYRQDPLKGVGCECCHGGARHHLGLAMKDRFAATRTPLLRPKPARENCIRCHTARRPCHDPAKPEPYERTEYFEMIKHWE